ncbi:MAG TPA: thioredoxin domain-containing protein [Candidatus Saccharimonadales bacterium]|nr:thioredoxin domain-containing protein [Candidatus Saccharimonadales bacterium]
MRPAWRSPIALLTIGGVLVAVVLLGVIQLLPPSGATGPATPGTKTAAGIMVPMIGTPAALADGRTIGRADAPLTLRIWSDFQCPACQRLATRIEPDIVRDYVATGKLRVIYSDFILIGPQSMDLAVAARCAGDQGRFWQYHDVVFANQGTENTGWATRSMIDNMADAVGLDRLSFDACLASKDKVDAVTAEYDQGKAIVHSTPTLDFGSKVIAGAVPYDQLKPQIDALLAAIPTTSALPGAPASP